MVGVGVIGTGFGRRVHIPGLLAVRNAQVIGVASHRPERAREVAVEFSLPRYFTSWRELIECPEIHAVTIATPPKYNEEISVAALAAEKAVVCEKPLALNATQAARMLGAARAAAVPHMVDFEFREIPAWRYAKLMLEKGELGSLRHANVTWMVDSWADPTRPWSWKVDRAEGGGVLASFGVHVFDYVEWLLGPVGSVSAQLSTRIDKRPDESGAWRKVVGEDCCNLLLELWNGTPVSIAISTVAPVGKGHWIEFCGQNRTLVLGSDNLSDYGKGFALWERRSGSPHLREIPVPPEWHFEREFSDGRIAPFVRLAQRFVDAVAGRNVEVRPSFQDGLRAQVLVDAAVESHATRRWMDVPLVQTEKGCQA
jgi:predicted dehydrogenase